MDSILTVGNVPLCGETAVQGSKNAALPLMAASVLHPGKTVLRHCPRILDVEAMGEILEKLGCRLSREGETLTIDASGELGWVVPEAPAASLRASVLLMGSLLGRGGRAFLPWPGGCAIGKRPVDLHLSVFEQLGARVRQQAGGLLLELPPGKRLRGARIRLPFPSVGATENALLGAALTRGTIVLSGCAREPEIGQLGRLLQEMGVTVQGIGSGTLTVTGAGELRDSVYTLPSDRIVAGTYLLAAAGTRGSVRLLGTPPGELAPLLSLLQRAGARIRDAGDSIELDARRAEDTLPLVETAPYPGFPTDLQSQLTVFLCRAQGTGRIRERLFESRFLIVPELLRMGADIEVSGDTEVIRGVPRLLGAEVTARELRGGAALVAAGLMAEGETRVLGSAFIRRGYEDIVRDLAALGAGIREST